MPFTISDFDLSSSNTSRFDMDRAVVATEGFRWLKETGHPLSSWDKVPAEAVENLEDWEIVDEIVVNKTHFCEYEGKLEYIYETTLLIAPVKETEKSGFFKFEDEAARMGFEDYAA